MTYVPAEIHILRAFGKKQKKSSDLLTYSMDLELSVLMQPWIQAWRLFADGRADELHQVLTATGLWGRCHNCLLSTC